MKIQRPSNPVTLRAVLKFSVTLLLVLSGAVGAAGQNAIIYPAPAGEPLSKDYQVTVDGQAVPVYIAKVGPADEKRRWKAMDDKKNSADFFDLAAFAYFDMRGPVQVTVTSPSPINTARVLPSSLHITPVIKDRTLTFTLAAPKPLTIEINGETFRSLHLFANPPETDVPQPGAKDVIYFGPGVHEISHLVVSDNQTVYVAGGAVVRAIINPDEKFHISGYSGLRGYTPTLELKGKNIKLRGRGIIDQGNCTTHARHMVSIRGSDILLEGVILRDASTWTVPVRQSERITIRNIKLLGHRANSDGIDICNSRDVIVEDCFIRTLDDLIVIKSDKGQGGVQRITARRCVLWNQVAHALSVGAELRENVEDVQFIDCDLIHDTGREWALRVYHCDAATISNIRFENIRIEEARRLISVWIGKAVWSRDAERGHIRGVSFKDISAVTKGPRAELKGFDAGHTVEDVSFSNVQVNGQPLTMTDVKTNAFTAHVVVTP
ncbi:MAG: glycosyl hydrolase family 28 protein [Kiritimatiellaeota bacterium]|nr:glycosyl hydrolase family 28 protein [Kiritimatiellota bacterium]